ncbi:hypothetical protein CEXT_34911 [Caerostris extrusa]|uniref:Uncharacterized protein n=1 Tax=Caerostris extrusa TaxID=172846 RepID=A0AAV4MDZ9_CAEEX|nr:hypothetical protein CEXT_34911 [Caerostris extrusa]
MEFPNQSPYAQQNHYPPRKKLLSGLMFTHKQGRRMWNKRHMHVLSEGEDAERGTETPSPLVNPFFRVSYARPALIGILLHVGALILLLMILRRTDDRNGRLGRNSRV